MISLHTRSLPFVFVLLFFSACGSGATQPSPVHTVSQTQPGPEAIGAIPTRFTATLSAATGSLTFVRADPDITPQSVDPINDPSGADGAPTGADVDLVSTAPCTFPTGQFQCNVKMIWGGLTRSLPNPVVVIDSATIGGVATTKYDANNSDGSNPLSFCSCSYHGLWDYTNSGEPNETEPVAGVPLFLSSQAVGFNTGARLWSFDNPTSTDVVYDILVYASLSYSNVGFDFGRSTYVDACAGGTSVTTSTGSTTVPFDVTIYDQNYAVGSSVNFALNGQITFGTVALSAATEPPMGGLPSAAAPAPSFWAFWDALSFGPGGQICYRTVGSAPNRQLVIEWRGVTFADAPDQGAVLDFEALVTEGTSTIDTVYRSMVAAPGDTSGREGGSMAWVGVQNATGTSASGTYQKRQYGSGNSYSYIGTP